MSDIKIVYRDENTGVLTIGIPRPPEYVEGIEKLVQIVVIELLTSSGRDIIDPNDGGNLRSLIGTNINYDDESEIFTEIKMLVSLAETNIKKRQVSVARKSNEQLASLTLTDVVPNEDQGLLEIFIRVQSMDQQSTQAIVGLR